MQGHQVWRLAGDRAIALDRPRIMAILNLTPDSFYEGSRLDAQAAVDAARRAVEQGADLLDIGGESTRPGAPRVPAAEQIQRIVPAIEAIRRAGGPLADVPITADTTLAPVAGAALEAGAGGINDVSAGTEDPGILELAASRRAGLVLMHRLAPPDRDSYSDRYDRPPEYADVVEHVRRFLSHRAWAARQAGVPRAAIVLDPGLGFGKSIAQNIELVRRTPELLELGYPILSAASRKSFVGRTSMPGSRASGNGAPAPLPPGERLAGSLAWSVVHLSRGAMIFRVHDAAEQAAALRAAWALRDPRA